MLSPTYFSLDQAGHNNDNAVMIMKFAGGCGIGVGEVADFGSRGMTDKNEL